MGNVGIVVLFVMVNLGLAAVLLLQSISEKAARSSIVAEVFSVSRSSFFLKVLLPLLYADILHIFFLVFVFCISSFSIPIIAGDGRAVNLEILVFEKIFIDNNWTAAFNISVLQSLLIFVISALILRSDVQVNVTSRAGRYLKSKVGVTLIVLYLSLYLGGYALGLLKSLSYIHFLSNYVEDILAALLFSLKALSLYVACSFALIYVWLWDFLKNKKFNGALNLISLSTVVIGFSIYLFFPAEKNYDLLKMMLAFSVLSFPGLFKLFLQRPIEALSRKLVVAEVFGLSENEIIFEVIIRQLKAPFLLWLGVLSLWFTSDYAVSKAVGLQTTTLGLLSEGFLSSYRMPLSYLMSLVIVVTIILFLFFLTLIIKVGYVAYKKLTP